MKPLSLIKYAVCIVFGVGLLGIAADASAPPSSKVCEAPGIIEKVHLCAGDLGYITPDDCVVTPEDCAELGYLTPEECEEMCSAMCEWPEYSCTTRTNDRGTVTEFSAMFVQDFEAQTLHLLLVKDGVPCSVLLDDSATYLDLEDLTVPDPMDPDNSIPSEQAEAILAALIGCGELFTGKDFEAIIEVIEGLPDVYTIGELMIATGVSEADIMGALALVGKIASVLPCLLSDGLDKEVVHFEGVPLTYTGFWDAIKAIEIDNTPEPTP